MCALEEYLGMLQVFNFLHMNKEVGCIGTIGVQHGNSHQFS